MKQVHVQFISGYMWFDLKQLPEHFIASRFCNWSFHFALNSNIIKFGSDNKQANIIDMPKLKNNKTVIQPFIHKLTFLSAVVVGPTILLCHENWDNQTNNLQSKSK